MSMTDAISEIDDILRETQNDIYTYLESDVPLECYQKDIDDKLSDMSKRILKRLNEEESKLTSYCY